MMVSRTKADFGPPVWRCLAPTVREKTRGECLKNLGDAVLFMLETEREAAFRDDPKAQQVVLTL